MCVTARNCKKITKTLYFSEGILRLFNVIDVDSRKQFVINVCAYLQPFLS